MPLGFIIMQIGNAALDAVCVDAIVPAMVACGLDAKRVDKHNTGGLLKSEIVGFIQNADIIVADLTNERPNCYLEVGYAMGLDRFRNLILTAREDHHHDSPHHSLGGPKIHFDLSGYDVLLWSEEDLPRFRAELEKRIRRRQAIIASTIAQPNAWDEEWFTRHSSAALTGFEHFGGKGLMEVRFMLVGEKPAKTQGELLEAARDAAIHTFGWPIGIMLDSPEDRPKPVADGIVTEVVAGGHGSYDYWALRRNGDFYLLHNLFEDYAVEAPNSVYFDSRIVRITETLLYAARLYSRLGILPDATVRIQIRHSGLAGRVLRASRGSSRSMTPRSTIESQVLSLAQMRLSEIEADLTSLVKRFTDPLFAVFEFFQLSDQILDQIVDRFVKETAGTN